MPGRIDEEALSRWLDNELESIDAEAVDTAVRSDQAVTDKAGRLDEQDANVRAWFEEQLPPIPAHLEQSIRTGFSRRRARQNKDARQRWWLPVAAVALVLGIGLVGFDYMLDRRVDAALDQMRAERASDLALLASAMQEVLETRESGIEVSYQNSDTGLSVTLLPRRTWKSASGHWCREFVEAVGDTPVEDAAISTACRSPNGRWQRVVTELPGAQAPFILDAGSPQDL